MVGAETELDRQVLELIKDPLTHMVRNSADHGLERPDDRKRAGKPEKGTIRLSAYHEGGHIIIEIADDGRGPRRRPHPPQGGRERARQRGRTRGDDRGADLQVHLRARLLHRRRRHVGLRPRRRHGRRAHQHRDDRRHRSTSSPRPGKGTTVTIKIPLTLAIVSTLIVECAGDRFAIPQLSVVELVRVQLASPSITSSGSTTRRSCACATSCCRSRRWRACLAARWQTTSATTASSS